jgi:hypothetical protein
MNRLWMILIVAASPLPALAQTAPGGTSAPYQPVVPAPSMTAYGGWPGGGTYGGGTVAGSAMNGMANVISAKGNYNLSTSAAAVNMTQAQRNEIQNRQLYTDTYFQMRATNRAAREREAGPRLTMEQLAKIAKDGVPRPLSPSEMDAVSGKVAWPSALQQDMFAEQRGQIEQLFGTRARYGGLSYADQMKVRDIVETMFDELRGRIREIPPQEYVACRNFLNSLSFAATKSELQ